MGFIATHIYRKGNSCADRLANYEISNLDFVWWNSLPNFIRHEFCHNKLRLPNYRFN